MNAPTIVRNVIVHIPINDYSIVNIHLGIHGTYILGTYILIPILLAFLYVFLITNSFDKCLFDMSK